MTVQMTRRTVLTTALVSSTVGLAGCSSVFGGDGDAEVVVSNDTDEELTANVSLVDDDGEELLTESETLGSGETAEYDDVFSSGTHTFSVVVEDGPTNSQPFEDVDGATLHARIEDDGVELETET